jgi:hypothetical protein
VNLTSDDRVHFARAVWSTFEQRRGVAGEMSTAEFDLIYRWMKRGIPLPIVLRGIEETAGKPRTLHACARAVDAAYSYWFQAIGGGELPL